MRFRFWKLLSKQDGRFSPGISVKVSVCGTIHKISSTLSVPFVLLWRVVAKLRSVPPLSMLAFFCSTGPAPAAKSHVGFCTIAVALEGNRWQKEKKKHWALKLCEMWRAIFKDLVKDMTLLAYVALKISFMSLKLLWLFISRKIRHSQCFYIFISTFFLLFLLEKEGPLLMDTD